MKCMDSCDQQQLRCLLTVGTACTSEKQLGNQQVYVFITLFVVFTQRFAFLFLDLKYQFTLNDSVDGD